VFNGAVSCSGSLGHASTEQVEKEKESDLIAVDKEESDLIAVDKTAG
jgi:hypothetical protein